MAYLRVAVFLALVAGASAAREFGRQEMAINPAHIDLHNKDGRSNWVAGENEFFRGKTLGDARKLMGTVQRDFRKKLRSRLNR